MEWLVATAAGAVGAVFRYLLAGWLQNATRSDFPVGTLVANLTGAFSLGVVAGGGDLESMYVVAAIGVLGGFTTFSTWMIETLRLGPTSVTSVLNLSTTLIAGVVLAAFGFSLTN